MEPEERGGAGGSNIPETVRRAHLRWEPIHHLAPTTHKNKDYWGSRRLLHSARKSCSGLGGGGKPTYMHD